MSRVAADGGPGDDVLVGGKTHLPLGDQLSGGGGRDELHGGDGPDQLSDGDRSNASDGAAPGPDVLDGGSGEDTVSYQQRTAAVSVDLADGRPDGEPADNDVLADVESIIGGRAADRLAGDGASNSIQGRGGRDRLIGRGGDDNFWSGNSVSCGRGTDVVEASSGPTFNLPSGTRFAPFGFLEPDCESRIDPVERRGIPDLPRQGHSPLGELSRRLPSR